jgi:hypothetical protein
MLCPTESTTSFSWENRHSTDALETYTSPTRQTAVTKSLNAGLWSVIFLFAQAVTAVQMPLSGEALRRSLAVIIPKDLEDYLPVNVALKKPLMLLPLLVPSSSSLIFAMILQYYNSNTGAAMRQQMDGGKATAANDDVVVTSHF